MAPLDRLYFLYLITNPHTHVSGIYYLPGKLAQHETGIHYPQLQRSSDTLSRLRLCRFDPPNELVWVVNMLSFQGSGQKNTLSAAYHLVEDIHNSPLINEFLKRYPEVDEPYKNRVSKLRTPDPDLRDLIPEQEQEKIAQSDSAESSSHVFVSLPLNDGNEFPIRESELAEWARLYPAVDIRQSARNMRGWLLANVERRKTARGIQRFCHRWLAREQDTDKGGNRNGQRESAAQRRSREASEACQQVLGELAPDLAGNDKDA